jgi:hypothetical protein
MKTQYFYSKGLAIFLAILTVLSFSNCKFLDPMDDPPMVGVGDTLWVHQVVGADSLFTEPSIATGTNGDVYFAVAGGTLYWTRARIRALDPVSGNLRWESPVLDANSLGSQILVGNNGVIYVIGTYNLYAIDPQTGQFQWVWTVPTELPNPDGPGNLYTYGQIGALAMADNGNLILGSTGAGVYSRAIYCIGPGGNLVWHNQQAAYGVGIGSGLVVGHNNRAFYYTDIQGQKGLVALDVATGAIIWTKAIYSMGGVDNNLALDADGTLIASFRITQADPSRMYRIDPANGQILWQSQNESNHYCKLVNRNGVIYQDDNQVGSIAVYTPGQASASAFSSGVHANLNGTVVTKTNQLIFVKNLDFVTTVHAYSSSGNLDWYVPFSLIRTNVLALSANQKIIGVRSNIVFALQGDQPLSDRGWPTRYHDMRNTSNLNQQ